jgi:predicted DNA-binding transcriptional regulator AlpA
MDYFTDKQVAARFGVHRTTIWRWIKNEGFPKPVQLSKGCTRFQEAPVRAWENKRLEGVKNA